MGSFKYACVVALMCMVVLSAPITEAITCGQVTSAIAKCLTYLRRGGRPAPACCSGVRALNGAVKTTTDRQAACNCLKSLAGSIRGLNPNTASTLPATCGVKIAYKISTSTNCHSIK